VRLSTRALCQASDVGPQKEGRLELEEVRFAVRFDHRGGRTMNHETNTPGVERRGVLGGSPRSLSWRPSGSPPWAIGE
jgi:hypothetical protein